MPRQFDSDLSDLQNRLLKMGGLAEKMIHDMIDVLNDGDSSRLAAIYQAEEQMDELEGDVDEETIRLIGIYTPVAGDLRRLLMISRINAELERTADKVIDIAHTTENFLKEHPTKPLVDLTPIAKASETLVRRSLDALQPRALLLMESELWPNMIRLTHARGIPIAVINGRISPRAFRRYWIITPWLSGMLARISLFLMQSQADADRVIQLGAPASRVRVVGSLKWDASLATRPTEKMLEQTVVQLGLQGGEPVIVAGSTHQGEEEAVLESFQAIRALQNDARLILAPRHLDRLAEVEALCRRHDLVVARTSQAASVGSWQVALVDVFGQLPRYYGLATIAFVGGSLIPHGGQNPLEAASLGKPIIFGPFMHNFAEIAQQLMTHRAARQLVTASELTPCLHELLANLPEACAMGARAQMLTEQSRGAAQRTLEALRPLLV